MAAFRKVEDIGEPGGTGEGAGWSGDFFDRLGQFWAEQGDAFSPFTRAAVLIFAALMVVLILRSLWRMITGRRGRRAQR